MVDPGEEIQTAVVREIFEETGIRTKFKGVLGFTEFQRSKFGLNDLYFLCLLQPITYEINKCELEIEDAKWFDVDEYVQSESPIPFFKKLKQMIWFVSQAQQKGENFDVCALMGDLPKEDLVVLQSLRCEFNKGKKGRERVYNLNYPFFSKNFNNPKL